MPERLDRHRAVPGWNETLTVVRDGLAEIALAGRMQIGRQLRNVGAAKVVDCLTGQVSYANAHPPSLPPSLPPYCTPEGLQTPTINDDASEWLTSHDPDALETLTELGVPEFVGLHMRTRTVLEVSSSFSELMTTAGGAPLGEACLVGENALQLRAPYRHDWLIAADGRFVQCTFHSDGQASYQQNCSYSSFLVFQTAFDRVAMDDEDALFAVLPELGRVDPWAFESEYSPWPTRCAELVYGDLCAWPEEERRIRAVALGT